jgi:hypothetical protein
MTPTAVLHARRKQATVKVLKDMDCMITAFTQSLLARPALCQHSQVHANNMIPQSTSTQRLKMHPGAAVGAGHVHQQQWGAHSIETLSLV